MLSDRTEYKINLYQKGDYYEQPRKISEKNRKRRFYAH